MESQNNTLLDKCMRYFAIIGAIIGTVFILIDVFGDWYTDFDIKPVELITFILTIVVFLLPVVISLMLGGPIGAIAGMFLGIIIWAVIDTIVSSIRNAVDTACKRKKRKIASREIHKENRNIGKAIAELAQLREEIPANEASIVSNYNLCCLLSAISDNNVTFKMCTDRCFNNYEKLRRIRTLELQVQKLADEYAVIGDLKSASYYKSIAEK